MVQHVVSLQVLEIRVFGGRVVQEVVDHVVEEVPKELPCRYCVDIGLRDYIGHWNYHEEEVDCEAWNRREYELQSIHRECVMNSVQHEMKSQYLRVIGQP